MAGFQPSEDEIQNFMAFVPMCTDRREAIARIKVEWPGWVANLKLTV